MTEADILLPIRQLLSEDHVQVDGVSVGTLGKAPGAYVLLMHLPVCVPFARRNIAAGTLSGWLVYVGSARGGGGIGARLRRHFRKDKAVHWHVDELTNVAARMIALAVPGGTECAIVDRLIRSGLFETALAGFGSSDCRRCEAHLLRPAGLDWPASPEQAPGRGGVST